MNRFICTFFQWALTFALVPVFSLLVVSCKDDDKDPGPEPAPEFTITALDPDTGAIGDTVTVFGSGFNPDRTQNRVFFTDGVEATPILPGSTDSTLIVEVPEGAVTGPITVQSGKKELTSTLVFTVQDVTPPLPLPAIDSIVPEAAPVGTEVLIVGRNFEQTGKDVTVFFDNTEATVLLVTGSVDGSSSIRTIVPDGLTPGVVQVNVLVDTLETAETAPFTVTEIDDSRIIYWTQENGEIYRASVNDQGTFTRELLYDTSDGTGSTSGIEIDSKNGMIYFLDQINQAVLRAEASGTGTLEILYDATDGIGVPVDIAVDFAQNRIYFTDGTNIYQGSTNGRSTETLSVLYVINSGSGIPFGIKLALANNNIYWTDLSTLSVNRGTLTQGTPEVLYDNSDGLESPLNIAIDTANSVIYIADLRASGATPGSILLKGDLVPGTSSTLTTVFDIGDGVGSFVTDIEFDPANNFLYWLNSDPNGSLGNILRGDVVSSDSELLFQNVVSGTFFDIE